MYYSTKDFKEKLRELEETAAKLEKEIKEDIRTLLHAIEQRDKTLLAIRKAYQKLDLDCKSAVHVRSQSSVDVHTRLVTVTVSFNQYE